MKWYFERGAGQEGPVTEEEIKAMVADGRLSPENKVWCKDLADWTAVALLPNLQSEPEPVAPAQRGPVQP